MKAGFYPALGTPIERDGTFIPKSMAEQIEQAEPEKEAAPEEPEDEADEEAEEAYEEPEAPEVDAAEALIAPTEEEAKPASRKRTTKGGKGK